VVCTGCLTTYSHTNDAELLRFLTTDAKVPLAVAMGYAKSLSSSKLMKYFTVHNANQCSAKTIAELKSGGLDDVIGDASHRKAIINGAKRVLKVIRFRVD
jgi:hypothetical protein